MYKKWETQIGSLIVFVVILLVWIWVVLIYSFLYKKYLNNASIVYVLWNKSVSLQNLQDLWLCKNSSYAKIDYTPSNDIYKLTCENNLGKNIWKFSQIDTFSGCSILDNFCKYKIRR